MAQSGVWPMAHAEALAAFFVALELHPLPRLLLPSLHARRVANDAVCVYAHPVTPAVILAVRSPP
jgi:hypothetical protein